jgi:hypothetical protein
MLAIALQILISSLLSIAQKFLAQEFFEAILTDALLFCGEKLVNMTSNTLDNQIFDEIKRRLQK